MSLGSGICDIDIQALAGGDKPPPLRTNLMPRSSGGVYPRPAPHQQFISVSQPSGGVYPRPYRVPVNLNRSDSVMLFRGFRFWMESIRSAGYGLRLILF